MKNNIKEDSAKKLEQALENRSKGTFVFRLYITGTASSSTRSVENIQKLCEEYLKDRYELTVVDILQQPSLLKEEQIVAAPTLLKKLPLPIRKFIGDLSDTEKILLRLDLRKK